MNTPVLDLVEIQQGQGSKEVTHNKALRQLEAKLLRVISRTTTAEPGSPNDGDTYIVPSGATGTNWSGQDGDVAHYSLGVWYFYTPLEGWRFWVNDEDVIVAHNGTNFVTFSSVPKYVVSNETANFTIQSTQNGFIFLVDASGGNVVITLPPATDAGYNIAVKKIDSSANTVTINPDSGNPDTIEGQSSLVLEDQWSGTLLAADGTSEWLSIGGGGGGAEFPFLDDEAALFANAGDTTKKLAYDLASISTGTTRTQTMPDKDGTLAMLSDVTGGGLASNEFDEDSGTTTGLTWGFQAGNLRVGNTVYQIAAGTVSLADNTDNFVFINSTNQTVEVNQTGHPTNSIPIRELTTSSGSISTNTDVRAWNAVAASGAESNRVDVANNANTAITLSSSDANGFIRTTASSAVSITVPSTTNFTIGDQVHLEQAGSGQITLAGDTGVTVNTPQTLKSRAQYSTLSLVAVDTDTWTLMGDLEAV